MISAADKVAYRINEAVAATGVPRSTLYEEIRSGRLRTRKLGARTLIMAEDLHAWLAQLESEPVGAAR